MQPESLILLVLLGGMLLLIVNRSRRQQREAQNLQSRITVGSRIMTTAGLHATVVAIGDGVVTLETGPGQTSVWDRRAVARLLPEDPPAEDQPAEDKAAEDAGSTGAEPGPAAAEADPPERA